MRPPAFRGEGLGGSEARLRGGQFFSRSRVEGPTAALSFARGVRAEYELRQPESYGESRVG